jgi:hypothetical protein
MEQKYDGFEQISVVFGGQSNRLVSFC